MTPAPEQGMPRVQDMQIDRFQMAGHVDGLDLKAQSISVHSRVPQDHSIFSGHFPGHPLMPGVLLTELMAQTCGFLLLSLNGFEKMPFLAVIKEVKLRSFVLPGTALVCKAIVEHDGSGFAVMKAAISRAGEEANVCDGTLTFRIVPYPNEDLHQHMLERAHQVGLDIDDGRVFLVDEAAP